MSGARVRRRAFWTGVWEGITSVSIWTSPIWLLLILWLIGRGID